MSGRVAPAREQMFSEVGAKLLVGRVGSSAEVAETYLAFLRGGYTTG